jgi:hypothetical protein
MGTLDKWALYRKLDLASKGITAVDGFIYDTRLDSDGGAWRVGFPEVVLVVVTSSDALIYDATSEDITLDRTVSLSGLSPSSVAAMNGKIVIGTSSGVVVFDAVNDDYAITVDYSTATTPAIVSNSVHDVAMTILDGAPIDGATGLTAPTIAVAMSVGVSIIDGPAGAGTVVDSANSSNSVDLVYFDADDNLWLRYGNSIAAIVPQSAYGTDGFAYSYKVDNAAHSATNLPSLGSPASAGAGNALSIGGGNGLFFLGAFNPLGYGGSLFAYIAADYNTGWMVGDIKGAFLSDTNTDDLVGGELVTNGTFDTDISGWTDSGTSGGSISWNASGALDVISDGVGIGHASQAITTVVGKTYVVSYDVLAAAAGGNIHFYMGGTLAGSNYYSDLSTVGSYSFSFVAASTVAYISLREFTNGTSTLDNISVRVADNDRSYNNNPIAVHGTLPRTPVATGAELVAYSGFSASNYLEQPYNPDLDFGTGDFCVMGWVTLGDGTQRIIQRSDNGSGVGTNGSWAVLANSGKWQFQTALGLDDSGVTYAVGIPHLVCVVISGGVLRYYVNGIQISTHTRPYNFSGTGLPSLYVGTGRFSGAASNPVLGGMALWRIGATAPPADQIAKSYEDEKVLFQPRAACTLYGTSSNVTAIDADGGVIQAGTSSGRSTFRNLKRVAYDADPVTTFISARAPWVAQQ